MSLADDPRTLSIMGEPTFRQKGEALYRQFVIHQWYLPWNFITQSWDYDPRLQQQWLAQGQAKFYAGTGQPAMPNLLAKLMGGVFGAAGGGLP